MTRADGTREDGRSDDELRPVRLTRGFQRHPAGSVLVEFGETKVLCAASVTADVSVIYQVIVPGTKRPRA